MTLLAVVILGAGLILLASSLDDTPIVTTFQKIISGQPIDWTGMAGVVAVPLAPGTITTPGATGCPAGWTSKTVSGQVQCIPPSGSGITSCPTGYMSISIGGVFMCVPSSTTVG